MTHPEKTLAVEAPIEELAALGVVVTGLLVVACPTGWQVAWLVVLAAGGGLRRWGRRLAASLGSPPVLRQGPEGG